MQTSPTTAATPVLVVEDEAPIRDHIGRVLAGAGFAVLTAGSAAEAQATAAAHPEVELCLCDIGLPDMSGLDLVRILIALDHDIACVIVSGHDDQRAGERAIGYGVYSYLLKPFRENELLLAAKNALHRRQLALVERGRHEQLEELVRARTEELRLSQEETIRRLAAAIEVRDRGTGEHIERVAELAGRLAHRIGLPSERCELIAAASCLHDVGKIGIPDGLLAKPGMFTAEERAQMQEHAQIGHSLLVGSRAPVLQVAAAIALSHHEHYDGGGYPHGLAGDAIPVEGRIVAVCDVYDALTSDRPYRRAFSPAHTRAYIAAEAGTQFDPGLAAAFLTAGGPEAAE